MDNESGRILNVVQVLPPLKDGEQQVDEGECLVELEKLNEIAHCYPNLEINFVPVRGIFSESLVNRLAEHFGVSSGHCFMQQVRIDLIPCTPSFVLSLYL